MSELLADVEHIPTPSEQGACVLNVSPPARKIS